MGINRRKTRADLFAIGSLIFFVASTLAFGSIMIANKLLPTIGVDMKSTMNGYDLAVFLAGASITVVFLVYLAFIAWLVFGRLFLSPNAMWRVASNGPLLTKIDHWLLTAIVGAEPRV